MKKHLAQAVVLSLLLPASMGYAGFSISDGADGKILTGTDNAALTDYSSKQYGVNLNEFKEIHIDVNNKAALKTWSGRFNLKDTDLYVKVTGNQKNLDGIHLTNHGPNIVLNKYVAYIDAPQSDALNLSHDTTNPSDAPIPYADISELKAEVKDGSGIRANATLGGATNVIRIKKHADITIHADGKAGVYAGDDEKNFSIFGMKFGAESKGKGEIYLDGTTIVTAYGDSSYGLYVGKNGSIKANDIDLTLNGNNCFGIAAKNSNLMYGALDNSKNHAGSVITLNGNNNVITMNGEDSKAIYAESEYGVVQSGENGIGSLTSKGDFLAENSGTIKLDIKEKPIADNKKTSGVFDQTGGLYAFSKGVVDISSVDNIVKNGEITHTDPNQQGYEGYFGSKKAANAEDGGRVLLNAANNNVISGAVRASAKGSAVKITAGKNNYIYSSAHGQGYNENDVVLAAVFARRGAEVTIDGEKNFIATYCKDNGNEDTTKQEFERVVWAQQNGKITINGSTTIIASRAERNLAGNAYGSNSMGIAITAGSEKLITEDGSLVIPDSTQRSTVNINYSGAYGQSQRNYISGDIASGFNGNINIAETNAEDNIHIEGNVLAANKGEVNVSLGNGGYLVGRVDDYDFTDGKHTDIYNPVFSNEIVAGGKVNLKMGEGSLWNVTGQSWVTKLDMQGGIIDISPEVEYEQTSEALTIRNVKAGSTGTFVMDLNHVNHAQSDMLYIGNVVEGDEQAHFNVELKNKIEGWENIFTEKLRFATTLDKNIVFDNVTVSDVGVNDVNFTIGNEEYDEDDEKNKDYNGYELNPVKPGNAAIDSAEGEKQNWYINGIEGYNVSDAGETIINMSRANYSNAVYMDRLNKRMGEMRYVNDDDGLWVRMRHDRIGKEDSFRSKNTMYEIGYDQKVVNDGGQHRTGIAMDYMDGSTEYNDVAGKGEIKRKGLWLYDTWMGDKGHYTDYVVKWGHLSNDFEILTMSRGERVTGDYSNDVFSASAEYGKKNACGDGWYFEPQMQLQYARVTDADYKTSQNSEVSLDAIDSLIGRVGFRLGKDLSERSSMYIKADLLHEFLGDQTIYAKDITGVMERTYENKGTWYDVGIGFAAATGKNSYAYVDFEKSFGNDNDETYQINAGMNWSF